MSGDERTVYLNGAFLPLAEARISILDRGFQFADGVYEVIPVYGGRPFRMAAHLRRLAYSLTQIRLPDPERHADLADAIRELVAHNGGGDCSVYVQVTRGTAPRNHAFPETVHPTVVMTCTPLEAVPAEWLAEGVAAITMEDIRWDRCDIKAITLLPNVMARQRAEENGALEALWVHQGQVVEGAASNLFAVFDGTAVTPPDGPRVLPGITRNVVLELARERSLPVETAPLSRQDLDAAEEVWLTASTKAILPVTRLDDHKVGQGRPGPLFHEVLAAYRERIQQLRERTNEEDGQEGIP